MDIVQVLHAIILGIVQGVTEFIPISSSAHLIIVPWLFGWNDPFVTSLSFDVALHLGTLLAVLWFFAEDWVRLIRAWFASIGAAAHRRRSRPAPGLAACSSAVSRARSPGFWARARSTALFHAAQPAYRSRRP